MAEPKGQLRGSPEMGKIITTYQCDPEFRLCQQFQDHMNRFELGRKGIDTSELFVQGHPLFNQAAKDGEFDLGFPRVGVEWQNDDEHSKDLGNNEKRVLLNQYMRDLINSYRREGESVMVTQDFEDEDFDYEQVSSKFFDDFLNFEGYIEYYRRHVTSRVLLTGWATGNAGRKTALFLYMATDALLPSVATRIYENFKTPVSTFGESNTNIINDQFGTVAYGFEIMLEIKQIKTTYITLPGYEWPKKPDIYMTNSRTQMPIVTEEDC